MSLGLDQPSTKTASSFLIFVVVAIAVRCVCPLHCDQSTTDSNCSFSELLVTEKSQKMNQSANQSLQFTGLDFEQARKKHRKKLYVGYLTAAKGDLKERQGLLISGAMTLALSEINGNPNLLPDVELVLKWNDTLGDTVKATKAMIDMICQGVSVFFGPEGSCFVEATVALAENIPMISYKCADYKASEIPVFAKTEPPNTQVTKYVISLLRYYRWYQFSVIYEDSWSTVAQAISETAISRNMTVTVFEKVKDPHVCCEEKLSCCQSSYWYQFIDQTKNKTRIYVFLGTKMLLIDMMNAMQNTELFKNGEYMVIYVDMNVYSLKEAFHYLKKTSTSDVYTTCHQEKDFIKRAKSLLVIASTAPTDNYEIFTDKVRKYNREAPFFYQTSNILNRLKYQKFVSIYAAYLYDSVMLYAWALDQLLRNEQTITDEQIEIISKNGTKIIETVIKNKSYQSITGATIKFDKCGDSEGNFSVLAFKKANARIMNYTCDYSMVPVAQFQQSDFPEYRLNSLLLPIDWPGGQKPNDAPACGFNNELCPKDNSLVNSAVVASVLGFVLFCSSFVIVSVYRKWKIEQEIEGLLWKIDPCELQNYMGSNMFLSSSKASLMSASFYSYETQIKAQVFAYIAEYRGMIVRIKELKLSRKRDISREMKKEMRLLREMKHDNINAFIGAIVEPSRLLLITDYCAKGSLYDIIENEDIKLDDMFIFSLVHDLVKGMIYIHRSAVVCHGNLKSSNCVVTSRWLLQVSDFGLNELRQCPNESSLNEHQQFQNLLWKAPELLRDPSTMLKGTQKGDVYSFAIILYELIGRKGPFGNISNDAKEIIEMVKNCADPDHPFRPNINFLLNVENSKCSEFMISCMTDCWSECPEARPDFVSIRAKLKNSRGETNQSIMDQMMEMMEKYANNLEDLVNERTRLLHEEKKKSEDLLHRILPEPVAQRLTKGLAVEPEYFDSVTIYFSDIVGFTALSAESTPLEVVNFLNDLYTVFDRIIKGFDVYKVETIGDAYMVVSGLPIRNNNAHAGEIASMALEILAAVKKYVISHKPNEPLMLRIGIHTGPVVAGIVGLTMPRYCLFGDTVNTASRMESNGEALKIHISEQCKIALDKIGGYVTEERGLVELKGKGQVKTFWLKSATDKAVKKRILENDMSSIICYLNPKLTDDSRQTSFCEKSSRKMFQPSYSRYVNVNGDSVSTLQDYSNFITQNNNNYLHPNHHHYHNHHQNNYHKPNLNNRVASLITVNSEELSGPKSSNESRKSSLSNHFRMRNCKSLDFKHFSEANVLSASAVYETDGRGRNDNGDNKDDDDDDDDDKSVDERQQLLRNDLRAAGFAPKVATEAVKSSNSGENLVMKPLLSSERENSDADEDVHGARSEIESLRCAKVRKQAAKVSLRRSRCQSLELIPEKVQWRFPNESGVRPTQAIRNMFVGLFDKNADRTTTEDQQTSDLNIKIDL